MVSDIEHAVPLNAGSYYVQKITAESQLARLSFVCVRCAFDFYRASHGVINFELFASKNVIIPKR